MIVRQGLASLIGVCKNAYVEKNTEPQLLTFRDPISSTVRNKMLAMATFKKIHSKGYFVQWTPRIQTPLFL
jgi:hypothetical protein